jgi:putative CocE/NonD family hydrolase
MRTPYSKDNSSTVRDARWFASHGFAVATQDKRGAFESGGVFQVIGGRDPQDGYETIDWLAAQPWSNGRVGTYGCSYLGEVQIIQAPLKNPHLKAMVAQAAGSAVGKAFGRYRFASAFNGGAFELAAGIGWLYSSGTKVYYRPPQWLSREQFLAVRDYFEPRPKLPEQDYQALWRTLPWVDALKAANAPPTDFDTLLVKDFDDPFWDTTGTLDDHHTIDVPTLHINSWYDYGIAETMLIFDHFSKKGVSALARDNQFAVISPTTHCQSEEATSTTLAGRRPVGDARLDHWSLYLAWFDHWLRSEQERDFDGGIPPLKYYLMGGRMGDGEWRSARQWPLRDTRFTRMYLSSGGAANSRFGDGVLSLDRPGDQPPDRFVYDPEFPVPTVGGPVCCTATPDAPPGGFDQRDVEMRTDVLIYTSEPLDRGVEVTGPLSVTLFVSSDAIDTDFTAKLVDVYPDGTAYNVQEGILRARYRDGFDRKVWLEPGKIAELTVDLHATSNRFGPGHRIRLEISSSNFPRFDRNMNTGGNTHDETQWNVAVNRIHHDGEHASFLLLPVIGDNGPTP